MEQPEPTAVPAITVIIAAGRGRRLWPTVQSVLGQSLSAVEVVIVGVPGGRRLRRRLDAAGAGERVTFARDADGRGGATGGHVMFVGAGQVLERHACMTLYSAALRSGAPVVSGCGERTAEGCSAGVHHATAELSGSREALERCSPSGLLFRRAFLEETGLWPYEEGQSRAARAAAEQIALIPHAVIRARLARPRRPVNVLAREEVKSWVYHRLLVRLPVRRGGVVFESQEGRAYGGSPRAIYEELRAAGHPARASWSHAGERDGFPRDASLLRRGSWAYYWALARAQVWVDDCGFPAHLRKRPATTYVQTWHGAPVAFVGFDAPGTRLASRGDQRKLQRAIDRFDYVVVGSDYERRTLVSALRAKARILAVGQPRNDALITGGDLERVERLRAALGLAGGGRTAGLAGGGCTVLYAPERAAPAELDVRMLAEVLGDGARVLVRAGTSGVAAGGPVVDVSAVQDVTSLLLLSDVLVTDGAALMFDFALLDRPIIVHAPDLEDHVRRHGAYVDLAAEAPGPLTRTTAELLAALGEVRAGRECGRAARRRFAQRYGEHENGTAAKTVVERFLAPGSRQDLS